MGRGHLKDDEVGRGNQQLQMSLWHNPFQCANMVRGRRWSAHTAST